MHITQTMFADVLILEPRLYGDERGYFFESYNKKTFIQSTGANCEFVQDNQSRSAKHVLRGLHYQIEQPQGKLIRVIAGKIFDVVVDLRKRSKSFGRWAAFTISDTNKQQLWVPAGYAHGFLVLSEYADVLYKTTDFYAPEHERCIHWADHQLAVEWPLERGQRPAVSPKDEAGLAFKDAVYYL
jgi:dTDP-4-dehydrorhamnose 3,5-epimerase